MSIGKEELAKAIEDIQAAINLYSSKYVILDELFEEQKEKIYTKLYELNVEKVRLQVQLEELSHEGE